MPMPTAHARALEVSGEGYHKPDGGSGDQRPPSPNDQTEDEATCDECSGDDDLEMMPRFVRKNVGSSRTLGCYSAPRGRR